MKVLFLAGAHDIHTVRWVNMLTKKGNEVILVYCKNHKPAMDKIDQKVKLVEMPYQSGIGYYLNAPFLRKIARTLKPNVINAHYASGYGTLARVSKVKPLVLSVWGADVYTFPYQSKIKMDILLKNLRQADLIASTSHIMAKQVRKLLNNPDQEIVITPFGIELSQFKMRRDSLRKSDIKVGIIKKITEKYGIRYLIEAMRILIETLKQEGKSELAKHLQLLIYGDGDQAEEMKALTHQLQLDGVVEFMGRIPNEQVPKALEEMDLFVVSSITDSESFGVSVVEAMAAGLPVVATDVGGFKEVIEDGKTGIIVPRGDSRALAMAMKQLILSEDQCKQMGSMGRQRVEELYQFEDNVEIMIQAYQSVQKI